MRRLVLTSLAATLVGITTLAFAQAERHVKADFTPFASTAMEPDSRGTQGLGLGLTARPRAGGSVLGFGLSTGGRVKLEVFDVAGRKLATLVDAVETAGNHEIAWDGATAQGRAASGFYFARITTAEGRATATVPLAE